MVGVRWLALPRRRVRRRRVPPVDMTGVRQWVTANRLQVAVTVHARSAPRCGDVVEREGERLLAAGDASGRPQRRRSASESVRFVYQSELPLAIGLAEARVRRDALRDLVPTDAEVVGELAAADQLVGQLRAGHRAVQQRAGPGRHVRDVGRWVRRHAPPRGQAARRPGHGVRPEHRHHAGRRLVGAAGAWLGAAGAGRDSGVRRGVGRPVPPTPSRAGSRTPPDVGLVPTPWTEPRAGRAVAALALAAWLALPVLTAQQLASRWTPLARRRSRRV